MIKKYFTDEERKEARKKSKKVWAKKNLEKIKAYREANKEQMKEATKALYSMAGEFGNTISAMRNHNFIISIFNHL